MGRGLRTVVFIAVAGFVTLAVPVTLLGAESRPAIAAPAVAASVPRAPVSAVATPAYSPATQQAVRAEADWILTAQLFDGAIAHYPDKVAILPYLANYGAVGLVRASKVTGDPRYLQSAWRWLFWYRDHENVNGYVTDYVVQNTEAVSTGTMDSTDAYAGTFLYAAWSAWDAGRDTTALGALRPGVAGALRAIESTLDSDGLTWAKPDFHVKYLMDQAEVYAGLRSAAALATVLGDRATASRASSEARRLKAAVAALWNPATASYDWAVHGSGVHTATNWSVFYPDALEQMWAVAFGLTDARSTAITSRFGALHPYWDAPTASWAANGQTHAVEYWPVAGWAYAVAGSPAQAALGSAGIRSAALSSSRAWPYTPGIAGQLITLTSGGPSFPG
jgi:hypothetical protein